LLLLTLQIISSSGLGFATVEDLLSQQAFISVVDRSPPPNTIAHHPNLKFFKTDISNLSQIEAAVKSTVAWARETKARLGGVINCAGVGTAAKIIDAHAPFSGPLGFCIGCQLDRILQLDKISVEASRQGRAGGGCRWRERRCYFRVKCCRCETSTSLLTHLLLTPKL